MVRRMTRGYAAALLAAAPMIRPRGAWAQSRTTIRLGSAFADSYAHPYFALDGGFFRRAGIDVELTMLSNGSLLAAAMAGNTLDVALADPLQIAHPVNAGVPFSLFAGGGMYTSQSPTTLVLVAKNSPLKQPRDLEGQTFAVAGLGSLNYLAVHEWLRQSGANPENVRFVELPYPEIAPAIVRGTVTAGFLGEPFITSSRDELRVFAKAYDAISRSFYINGWFATRSWLAANPDLARRVGQVAVESARWANTHHAETAAILVKYLKIDPKISAEMTRVTFATGLDARQIQPVLDIAYRYKQLAKPVNAHDIITKV